MNSRLLKLSAAGLGLLALSCTGMRLPTVPRNLGEAVQTANTVTKAAQDVSECDKLDTMPSVEEEYALGGSIAINWAQQGGGLIDLKTNTGLLTYLNVVGKNLGAQSSRPTLRWTFGVLQTDASINALSTPGGYIFVTRKLLQNVENEAQLAGVLAHEIAHVTERHVLNRYAKVKVRQCQNAMLLKGGKQVVEQRGAHLTPRAVDDLLGIVKTFNGTLDLDHHVELLGSFTDDLVGDLVDSGLDRDEEFAADEQAVRMLVSAGYDPQEYIAFLSKLPESKSVFAHHPSNDDRKDKLGKFLKDSTDSKKDFPEFAAGTSGLVRPPLPPEFATAKGVTARDKP